MQKQSSTTPLCSAVLLASVFVGIETAGQDELWDLDLLPFSLAFAEAPGTPPDEAGTDEPLTVDVDDATPRGNGGGSGAAEMARKLQDPLANIRALMSDNAVGFNTGTDNGTSYAFQLQPVYAVDFPEAGFTLLPRAVIPILGLEPGTDAPRLGDPVPPGSSSVWGLGDIVLQTFVAPKSGGDWKWGVGPQFSFDTATDSGLSGSNWGAGVAGVVTGDITPELSFAAIVGNLWSFNGDYSTALIQPTLFYNISALPGFYVGYNAAITADWKASARNTWTVPLGLSVGKTFDLGNSHGFDVSVGPYYNVARPDGAADWQIRFGITWLLP